MSGTYADFPACLTRYAWLLDQGDAAFDTSDRCKACGGDVPRSEREKHLREHRAQLAAIHKRTRAENVARLRAVNRLRRETATATRRAA